MNALIKMRECLKSERGSMAFSESLALKVFSLLLALILWITILGFRREEVKINVRLEPLLPPGMMITSRLPPFIQFSLQGPRVWLKEAERKVQPIRPDLRRTRETTIGFSISEDLIGELPQGVRVTGFYPPQILIRLEEVIERYVPVRPTLSGNPENGYEVSQVKSIPSRIAVSGPRSLVESLESIGTEAIDIEKLQGTKDGEVAVEVDTAQGFQLSREKLVRIKISTRKVRLND